MKLVLDTDVIAAALLGEPGVAPEAARILAGPWELNAPAHWKAEFGNVVWKATRLRRIPATTVDGLLGVAEALPIASVEVSELWRGAVARAIATGHPTYDTLFVELAVRLDTHVASYDAALRRRFPAEVRKPEEILATIQPSP